MNINECYINFIENLPAHKAGMTITHNNHKNYYQTADQWIEEDEKENEFYTWENEQEKQKAIAKNEIWTMQWYPNTPVGFNCIAASSLESLLTFAAKY